MVRADRQYSIRHSPCFLTDDLLENRVIVIHGKSSLAGQELNAKLTMGGNSLLEKFSILYRLWFECG